MASSLGIRGLALTLKAYSRIGRSEKWEPEAHLIQHLVKPDDVVWQVGASDGQYTGVIARMVPEGRVIAFEPSSYTYQVAQRVCRLAGLKNVDLHNLAASNNEEDLELVIPVKGSGRLGHSFSFVSKPGGNADVAEEKSLEAIGQRKEVIKAVRLDDFAARIGEPRCDFLRIDVEGAEGLVLEGAAKMVSKNLPTVMIELHPAFIEERFPYTCESVRDGLLDQGYEMYHLGADGEVKHSTEIVHKKFGDYIFIHRSKLDDRARGPFAAAKS